MECYLEKQCARMQETFGVYVFMEAGKRWQKLANTGVVDQYNKIAPLARGKTWNEQQFAQISKIRERKKKMTVPFKINSTYKIRWKEHSQVYGYFANYGKVNYPIKYRDYEAKVKKLN